MKTEYQSDLGFGQRDSVEREEYDKALSTDRQEAKNRTVQSCGKGFWTGKT